jgi:hypothetical protein
MMRFRLPVWLCALALFAAGCASTTLRDQWSDPAWRGEPFTRFYVLGIGNDVANRRIFEDAMVARFAAAGVQAVPSYRDLPESARATEAQIDAAVANAGADALLMTRVKGVQRETQVSTVMVPGPLYGPGWYGWYSTWYAVPEVRQYDIAVVETSVFDARSKALVWTGVTETFNPRSVQQEVPGFADLIARAISARGLLPAGR